MDKSHMKKNRVELMKEDDKNKIIRMLYKE